MPSRNEFISPSREMRYQRITITALLVVLLLGVAAKLFLERSSDTPSDFAHQTIAEEHEDPANLGSSDDPDVIASLQPPPDDIFGRLLFRAQRQLQQKGYKDSVRTVIALTEIRSMSSEQMVSLRNTIFNIKTGLAEASIAGDTNADEAIQYFRNNSPAGR